MSENMIYKYYAPTDYNMDALVNKYFWFSKRSNLNDPYEMNIQILEAFPKFKKLLEKKGFNIERYNELVDNYAICSFTTTCDNNHFWSLYADNFQGWCLGFDRENLVDVTTGVTNRLYDAIYLEEVPNLDNPDTRLVIERCADGGCISETINGLLYNNKTAESLFAYLLCIKNKEVWSSEKEKRLILGNNYLNLNSDKISLGSGYKIPWGEGALKRIIVGNRIASFKKELLILLAKDLGVDIYEAKPDLVARTFSIKVDKLEV